LIETARVEEKMRRARHETAPVGRRRCLQTKRIHLYVLTTLLALAVVSRAHAPAKSTRFNHCSTLRKWSLVHKHALLVQSLSRVRVVRIESRVQDQLSKARARRSLHTAAAQWMEGRGANGTTSSFGKNL
jgi:hypothetical protein